MGGRILSARSDFIFKMVFGDEKNADVLAAFLKTVLDLPESEYKALSIVDPHLKRETADGKLGILDVLIHTMSGKIINVEIQVLALPEMRERIVFYASKLIAGQIGKGESYEEIKKVICIVITDYIIIEENNFYHNQYRLRDPKTRSQFTDILEVNTLELPKLPAQGDDTELGDWLRLIRSENEEELNMLAQKNAELKKAVAVIKDLSADEQTRMLYEAREKAWRDEQSRIRGAWREGRQDGRREGRRDGRAEEKIAIAKNLFTKNMPLDDISEVTGLTKEELQRLQDGGASS